MDEGTEQVGHAGGVLRAWPVQMSPQQPLEARKRRRLSRVCGDGVGGIIRYYKVLLGFINPFCVCACVRSRSRRASIGA